MFFRKKKKATVGGEEKALKKMATRPAYINVHMIEGIVRETVFQYLTAIVECDVHKLPMSHMEERLYNKIALELAHNRSIGNGGRVDEIIFERIQSTDYDNSSVYMVSSLTFEIDYHVSGFSICDGMKESFQSTKYETFVFNYDGRMGWLLSEHLT